MFGPPKIENPISSQREPQKINHGELLSMESISKDASISRQLSLTEYFEERESIRFLKSYYQGCQAQSCPRISMRLPPGLEDAVEAEEVSVKLAAREDASCQAEWFGAAFEFGSPQFWTHPMQQPFYGYEQSLDASEEAIEVVGARQSFLAGKQPSSIMGETAFDINGHQFNDQVFHDSTNPFVNEQLCELSWEQYGGQSFNDCFQACDVEMPWPACEMHASEAAQQYALFDEQLAMADSCLPPAIWSAEPSSSAILSTSPPKAQ